MLTDLKIQVASLTSFQVYQRTLRRLMINRVAEQSSVKRFHIVGYVFGRANRRNRFPELPEFCRVFRKLHKKRAQFVSLCRREKETTFTFFDEFSDATSLAPYYWRFDRKSFVDYFRPRLEPEGGNHNRIPAC